ncbi:MAG TPA: WecB/TagA/CpsF family glycosyltransferase [Streptosporangiaceae bacterium]|nr:WecB/TagA/CpsF family glycosyltransferase [Streptosporangiaceae bacterium]
MLTQAELIDNVVAAIRRERGGTIVTPNVDICHRIGRDVTSRGFVTSASFVVPDGMPLLWAARLAGRPLVERITGSDLIYSLSGAAAANGWSIYLIGGVTTADGRPSAAALAGDRLSALHAGLKVAGTYAPAARFNAMADDIDVLCKELAEAEPKIVFVGLGFPKQERLIARLIPHLPDAWFVGCGAAIPYAAGELRRAPAWMQRTGLEWVFRLISEPRRLAGRYLRRDVPFAALLLARSTWQGLRRRRAGAA